MKIHCNRETLASAFQLAATVAPARSPKEILNNVKLSVSGDQGVFTATDMEVGIRVDVQDGLEIEAEGSVLLPVSRVVGILRESTAEKITIETTENDVLISGGRSRFKLQGANPDEFPRVVGFDEEAYHEISTRLFREMVKRTVFATDSESSRYALGGVLLELEGDSVIAVGTDGRRLARMQGTALPVGEHKTTGANTIVPSRAIQLMERAASDDPEGEVYICARANDVLMRTKRCTIYSRLVEGRYPNWRQVLPQRENVNQINLTVGPLFAALRQAALVTAQDSRGIEFTFDDGTLRLEANTAEIGQSVVEIPVAYDGERVNLMMDHRFVADFCKALDPETNFLFELEDEKKPAMLSTEDGYCYVIMPMSRDR